MGNSFFSWAAGTEFPLISLLSGVLAPIRSATRCSAPEEAPPDLVQWEQSPKIRVLPD